MLFLKDCPLFVFVRRGQGEKVARCARSEGASGATIIPSTWFASNHILNVLGIGDTAFDTVIVVSDEDLARRVSSSVSSIPKISGFYAFLSNGDYMACKWKMVNVIVNAGFADDVMAAARNAGATGGTVIHARGTAVPGEDNTFLGVTIVPEKEMIVMLTDSDKADAIVDAVMSLDCLSEPGTGIVFVQNVADFRQLGK